MADAPAGGGSSWGPFEVVLVLLLAIAILSNLGTNNKTTVVETPVKKTIVAPLDDSANRCGLSIVAPLSAQKVYDSVRLKGSINGCNWKPDGQTALFAQIINGAGVPVSDFTPVMNNGSDFINTAFDTTVYLTTVQPSGTGYLLLIPAVQQSDKTITVRIPIRFTTN